MIFQFRPLRLNLITCYQHDGAQAELADAQNQMESIKEKVKTKDSYIVGLQEKIEKHQTEASEALKIEQVSYFLSGQKTALGETY